MRLQTMTWGSVSKTPNFPFKVSLRSTFGLHSNLIFRHLTRHFNVLFPPWWYRPTPKWQSQEFTDLKLFKNFKSWNWPNYIVNLWHESWSCHRAMRLFHQERYGNLVRNYTRVSPSRAELSNEKHFYSLNASFFGLTVYKNINKLMGLH